MLLFFYGAAKGARESAGKAHTSFPMCGEADVGLSVSQWAEGVRAVEEVHGTIYRCVVRGASVARP